MLKVDLAIKVVALIKITTVFGTVGYAANELTLLEKVIFHILRIKQSIPFELPWNKAGQSLVDQNSINKTF